MNKLSQKNVSKTIKSIEDIIELPIPIDEMNRFFDELIERNGDKIKINQENFPMYNKYSLENSKRKAENFTQKYEHDISKKNADLLEKSVYLCAELSNWLGDDVTSVLTSDYDDYFNGVDMIFEFNQTNKNLLGLAIDVTYSKDIAKKFEKLKNDLDKGYLSRVVFYKSDDYSGILQNLPKVIIELTHDEIISLAKKIYFSLNKNSQYKLEDGVRAKINEELTNSPIQYLILLQSIIELIKIKKYVDGRIINIKKQKSQEGQSLLKAYERMLIKFDRNISILSRILSEKLANLKNNNSIDFSLNSTKNKVSGIVNTREYCKYLGDNFFGGRYREVEKIVVEFDFIFKTYPKVWGNISENLRIFD